MLIVFFGFLRAGKRSLGRAGERSVGRTGERSDGLITDATEML